MINFRYIDTKESYHEKQVIVDSYRARFNSQHGHLLPNVRVSRIYKESFEAQHRNEVTISLPVCNQEVIIEEILTSLLMNCEEDSNLIIILDACQDASKAKVIQAIEEYDKKSKIRKIIVLESDHDLFESTCENLALELLDSKYFLSLQADIYYSDSTFLSRGITAFEKFSDLLGISGRAIIPADNRKPYTVNKYLNKYFSAFNSLLAVTLKRKLLSPFYSNSIYFGDLSSPPHNKMMYSRRQISTVYIGDSVIRGPIIWRTSFLKKLGLFDDFKYFLGGDEREMSIQGFNLFGYKVGFLATTCYTNLWTGTSHNPQKRTRETLQILEKRKELQQLNGGDFRFEVEKNDYTKNSKGQLYKL